MALTFTQHVEAHIELRKKTDMMNGVLSSIVETLRRQGDHKTANVVQRKIADNGQAVTDNYMKLVEKAKKHFK